MRLTIYLAIAIAILFSSLSDAKSLNKRKHHHGNKKGHVVGGDNGTLDQAKISGFQSSGIVSPKITRRKLQDNKKRQQPSVIPDTSPLVNGLIGGLLGGGGPLKGLTPQTPPASQPYYYSAPVAPAAAAPPPPNVFGGLLGGLYPPPPR